MYCPYCNHDLRGQRLKFHSLVHIALKDGASSTNHHSSSRAYTCPHCDGLLILRDKRLIAADKVGNS